MIVKTDKPDEQGHEFDYFDEYPEEDPFMPKATCIRCGGSGEEEYERWDGEEVKGRCGRCLGSGVEP